MKYISILLIFFSSVLTIEACSYTMGTFAGKVISSDIIIKGKVIDIIPSKSGQKSETVRLKIENILKGSFDGDLFDIFVDLSRLCPGPDKFTKGENLIAFLRFDPKNNYYFTNGYYYGNESFNKIEVLNTYEKIVNELIKIQRIGNNRLRTKEMMKWSIDCLQKNETRHIAVEEFSPKGFYFGYDNKKKGKYCRLTRKQKRQIKAILFSIDSMRYNDNVLIELVAKKKDKKMINLALKHLKQYDKNKGIGSKERNLMGSIVKISKRQDLRLILDKIKKIPPSSSLNIKKMINLTEEFIIKV